MTLQTVIGKLDKMQGELLNEMKSIKVSIKEVTEEVKKPTDFSKLKSDLGDFTKNIDLAIDKKMQPLRDDIKDIKGNFAVVANALGEMVKKSANLEKENNSPQEEVKNTEL